MYYSSIKAAGADFSTVFKLAYHTGKIPVADSRPFLFSLFATTLPKIDIALKTTNRFLAARGWQQIPIRALAIPKTTWTVSYWAVGLSTLVVGACMLEDKQKPWISRKIAPLMDQIERVADVVSVVAAVGLISVGQVFTGSVMIVLFALQLLERYHYISPETSFIVGCVGYLSGILTAQTIAQKAFYLGLECLHIAGRFIGAYENSCSEECEQTEKNKSLHKDHLKKMNAELIGSLLFLGVHHPEVTAHMIDRAVCWHNAGYSEQAIPWFTEVRQREKMEGCPKEEIDQTSRWIAGCLADAGWEKFHQSKYSASKDFFLQAEAECRTISGFLVNKGAIQFGLGEICRKQKNYAEAHVLYDQAIKYFKEDAEAKEWNQKQHALFHFAYIGKAKAELEQKHYAKVMELCEESENFKKLPQIPLEQVHVLLLKAHCYREEKSLDKAEDCYTKALQLDHPNYRLQLKTMSLMFAFLKETKNEKKQLYQAVLARAQELQLKWTTKTNPHPTDKLIAELQLHLKPPLPLEKEDGEDEN